MGEVRWVELTSFILNLSRLGELYRVQRRLFREDGNGVILTLDPLCTLLPTFAFAFLFYQYLSSRWEDGGTIVTRRFISRGLCCLLRELDS